MMSQIEPESPDWVRKKPKMNEQQWNVYRRPISLVLNIGLIVSYNYSLMQMLKAIALKFIAKVLSFEAFKRIYCIVASYI